MGALASAEPFLHINSLTPISPEIGTIVSRYSFPNMAACHGVEPSYDFPINATFPLLQFC